MYVTKAEREDRIKEEVGKIICRLTGYFQVELEYQLQKQMTFGQSFVEAPVPNPSRFLTTGVVCDVRVEDIGGNLMREICYLDKMVGELAKGKKMEKIFRS